MKKVSSNCIREKYNSIDLAKFIMSIVVVAIHTYPSNNNYLYIFIIGLAVPFFFISAGFLLGKKINGSFYEEDSLTIIRNYLNRIIKLYIIWNIIYLPLAIWDFVHNGFTFINALWLYIKGFIFIGQQYNSWILWYLLSTIYALIFIYYLFKYKVNMKIVLIICLIIGLFSSMISTWLANNFENLTGFFYFLANLIKNTISDGRILRGIFYLPLGIYLSNKNLSILKSIILCVIGYLLLILFPELVDISIALGSLGFFGIIVNIKLSDSKVYAFFRTLSTVIYFIHLWVWTIYYKLAYGKPTISVDCFLITTIICIILGSCFYFYKYRKISFKGKNIIAS